MGFSKRFTVLARFISDFTGHSTAFIIAFSIIIIWMVTGPLFAFSDTWQLVINTGTTIVTFLMVFLIQNTQNRDSATIQIKLDELIRSHEGAHNALLGLDELTEAQLITMRRRYEALARKAREELEKGFPDTDAEDI